MALQKIGHQKNSALPIHERKSCWRNPYTWGGLCLMTLIPAPLDVGALAFAKYSVLAPFSGFTLVLNAIVAPVCLGETVEMVDYLGSALICFGTFVTTVYVVVLSVQPSSECHLNSRSNTTGTAVITAECTQ